MNFLRMRLSFDIFTLYHIIIARFVDVINWLDLKGTCILFISISRLILFLVVGSNTEPVNTAV